MRRSQLSPPRRDSDHTPALPMFFCAVTHCGRSPSLHRTPEGRIFELPVAWYTEKGGYWAMNPGFDSARQPDFRRQLVYECLSCHTGYPEIEPGADGSGREPLFP